MIEVQCSMFKVQYSKINVQRSMFNEVWKLWKKRDGYLKQCGSWEKNNVFFRWTVEVQIKKIMGFE